MWWLIPEKTFQRVVEPHDVMHTHVTCDLSRRCNGSAADRAILPHPGTIFMNSESPHRTDSNAQHPFPVLEGALNVSLLQIHYTDGNLMESEFARVYLTVVLCGRLGYY